jgi:hypothetical protein
MTMMHLPFDMFGMIFTTHLWKVLGDGFCLGSPLLSSDRSFGHIWYDSVSAAGPVQEVPGQSFLQNPAGR